MSRARWYTSVGFTELGRYSDSGIVNWGMLRHGEAEFMLAMHGKAGRRPVSLWFYMDDVEELYRLFKTRQLQAAKERPEDMIQFAQDLYDPFYGREFSIVDLNAYVLTFHQEEEG